jgi:hypothetical protein
MDNDTSIFCLEAVPDVETHTITEVVKKAKPLERHFKIIMPPPF